MTRFLCTLSLIFWSNEQVVHFGFGSEVGRSLVTKLRVNSKEVQSDSDGYKNKTVAHQIGSRVLVHYFLTVSRSLRSSNHGLYIRWQHCFIAEVVVAEPTFLIGCKVSSDCFNGCLVQIPWVTRVHE